MSKRRKKSSIKPLVPFFVLGVALIAVLIAIFKYNDESEGDSLTATVDESTASESLGSTPLTLSDEEVYNLDLMQANGVAMIDPTSYDSMADVIEDTMVEFGVDESQISLEFINYQTGESYTVNENNFQTAASTIKLPLSVIYVDAIDEGTIDWDTEVTYTYADYEEGDGTITAAVASGTGQAAYTIEDLIANALMYSDNTATNKNPLLKDTYNIVHNLREALQENDSEVFKAQLAQSKLVKLPSGLRRVLRTFTKLQRYIGHTFKYNHLTNGRIEGLNNKIKILKRIAYGYRNFQNFRTRILMTNKLYLNEIPVVEAA